MNRYCSIAAMGLWLASLACPHSVKAKPPDPIKKMECQGGVPSSLNQKLVASISGQLDRELSKEKQASYERFLEGAPEEAIDGNPLDRFQGIIHHAKSRKPSSLADLADHVGQYDVIIIGHSPYETRQRRWEQEILTRVGKAHCLMVGYELLPAPLAKGLEDMIDGLNNEGSVVQFKLWLKSVETNLDLPEMIVPYAQTVPFVIQQEGLVVPLYPDSRRTHGELRKEWFGASLLSKLKKEYPGVTPVVMYSWGNITTGFFPIRVRQALERNGLPNRVATIVLGTQDAEEGYLANEGMLLDPSTPSKDKDFILKERGYFNPQESSVVGYIGVDGHAFLFK